MGVEIICPVGKLRITIPDNANLDSPTFISLVQAAATAIVDNCSKNRYLLNCKIKEKCPFWNLSISNTEKIKEAVEQAQQKSHELLP